MDRCYFLIVTQQETTHSIEVTPVKDNISILHDGLEALIFFGTIIYSILTAIIEIRKHKKRVILSKDKAKSLDVIETYLAMIIAILGDKCSRVCVGMFENPDDSKSRILSAYKTYSIVWESVNFGFAFSRPDYQKVDIDTIQNLIDLCLAKPEEFISVKPSTMLPDATSYDLSINGNQLIMLRLVGSNAKGFVGMIGIQFNQIISSLPTDDLNALERYFLIIETNIFKYLDNPPES